MAERYARGCRTCNPDLAYALERMPQLRGYRDADAYWRLPAPRPDVSLDGENMMGKQVVATVQGGDGWLLRNVLNGMSADGTPGANLCPCGSCEIEQEVWRGNVEDRPAKD